MFRMVNRMLMMGHELATLNSSKAIAGKELSLSSWCIASLYVYHFSFELFSSMDRTLGL